MSHRAAHEWNRRIAVVFDLDDTLAPDTYGSVVERCRGVDAAALEREHVHEPRRKGWNETLMRSLTLSVEQICKRIALRELAKGE